METDNRPDKDISKWIQRAEQSGLELSESLAAGIERAILLDIETSDLQLLETGSLIFWQCFFDLLDNRVIESIEVMERGVHFQASAITEPQYDLCRFAIWISPMSKDLKDPAAMERYWQAVERGLAQSNVLETYQNILAPGFEVIGTSDGKKDFRRQIYPK